MSDPRNVPVVGDIVPVTMFEAWCQRPGCDYTSPTPRPEIEDARADLQAHTNIAHDPETT